MSKAMRQMPGLSGRSERQAGEARRSSDLDEAEPPPRNGNDTGAGLLEAALRRENLLQAWKQVRANKGAAGADGLDINQTAAMLRISWPAICDSLQEGTYRPQPVRRVMIPKPGRRARARHKVNETKSAVASVFGRKFLGYAFWRAGGMVKRRVADKAIKAFKDRIRELTSRVTGRSLKAVVERLGVFVRGWKAYFRLAQTPSVWRALDEWMRHRLRAIQLKQWKHSRTIFRELTARGASFDVAQQVAVNARRWWRNSG